MLAMRTLSTFCRTFKVIEIIINLFVRNLLYNIRNSIQDIWSPSSVVSNTTTIPAALTIRDWPRQKRTKKLSWNPWRVWNERQKTFRSMSPWKLSLQITHFRSTKPVLQTSSCPIMMDGLLAGKESWRSSSFQCGRQISQSVNLAII